MIDLTRDTSNVLGLMRYNALNYGKLKDDKAGLSSVRVNDQYRIGFGEHTKDGETVAGIWGVETAKTIKRRSAFYGVEEPFN